MIYLHSSFSLEDKSLGQLYATTSLESSAVSVSLSPTSKHLLVGISSRTHGRLSFSQADRGLMAQVIRNMHEAYLWTGLSQERVI